MKKIILSRLQLLLQSLDGHSALQPTQLLVSATPLRKPIALYFQTLLFPGKQ